MRRRRMRRRRRRFNIGRVLVLSSPPASSSETYSWPLRRMEHNMNVQSIMAFTISATVSAVEQGLLICSFPAQPQTPAYSKGN